MTLEEMVNRDYVAENFSGTYEMFIDPVAIYDQAQALKAAEKRVEELERDIKNYKSKYGQVVKEALGLNKGVLPL